MHGDVLLTDAVMSVVVDSVHRSYPRPIAGGEAAGTDASLRRVPRYRSALFRERLAVRVDEEEDADAVHDALAEQTRRVHPPERGLTNAESDRLNTTFFCGSRSNPRRLMN